jgi:hypothetical protein
MDEPRKEKREAVGLAFGILIKLYARLSTANGDRFSEAVKIISGKVSAARVGHVHPASVDDGRIVHDHNGLVKRSLREYPIHGG